MSKITITIETGNAAFENDSPGQRWEVTRILHELANKFSTFYNDCPVLKAATAEQRDSRLLLCDLTARTIKHGLSELLGIRVVEQM